MGLFSDSGQDAETSDSKDSRGQSQAGFILTLGNTVFQNIY